MQPALALIDLARNASPEARAELAAATADQLLNDPNETPESELELYGIVLAKLYPMRAKMCVSGYQQRLLWPIGHRKPSP